MCITAPFPSLRRLLVAAALTVAPMASSSDVQLDYALDLSGAPDAARVTVTVVQDDGQLDELSFAADDARFVDATAGSGLVRDDERYTWSVPKMGGQLSWRAPITHTRSNDALDARLTKRWALFRGEDVVPSFASRAKSGTTVTARLDVSLPEDWSFLSALEGDESGYLVEDTARRIDRPTGWMIAGQLGVRIDRIAGVRCVVAAPRGHHVRRQDMLAMLNWVMPDLVRLIPNFPDELLIVSAEDPFWRGGLSGPGSLYLHADRPLISENGTSTLVHELFHVGFRRSGGELDDWIVEGLAEYYSVQLLRRSGSTTASRFDKTMRSLARFARKADALRGPRSSGATTAKAVALFHALDTEIRRGSRSSLDDVVRTLVTHRKDAVSLAELQDVVREILGRPSLVLAELDQT